jgi:hypothetical protein
VSIEVAALLDALASLGQAPATVACERDDGDILLISWAEGWYTVTAMIDGRCSYMVGDPDATDGAMMIIGGVWTHQPRRLLLPAERALRAARHFVVQGGLDDSGDWEGDGAS